MFEIEKLREIAGAGNVREQEMMSKHTTFKIGGPAAYYIEPVYIEDFVNIMKYIYEEKQPYFILGNGSNLLVSDNGYEGIVVSTRNNHRDIEVKDKEKHYMDEIILLGEVDGKVMVKACSGVLLSRLAAVIADNSLAGFEFAGGIPGTLGGAVTMNAGAYGGELKDVIVNARVLLSDGQVKVLDREELELGYRSSIIQKSGMIVLDATFELGKGDKDNILSLMKDFNQRRRDKQPLEYGSAGSTFKRPEGYFAGKLIQDAGLKGYRVGDIMVSDKHSGFVVNVGEGTCEQAKSVIDHVQDEVKKQFGVSLEMEIRKLGW